MGFDNHSHVQIKVRPFGFQKKSPEVIHQDACSGGGCSFSCKSQLSCAEQPKLMGCNRMAPPFSKCGPASQRGRREHNCGLCLW